MPPTQAARPPPPPVLASFIRAVINDGLSVVTLLEDRDPVRSRIACDATAALLARLPWGKAASAPWPEGDVIGFVVEEQVARQIVLHVREVSGSAPAAASLVIALQRIHCDLATRVGDLIVASVQAACLQASDVRLQESIGALVGRD